MARLANFFNFNLRRDHQKYFIWSSRLWVGRQSEPILGYVLKYDERMNSGSEELIKILNNYQIIIFWFSFGNSEFSIYLTKIILWDFSTNILVGTRFKFLFITNNKTPQKTFCVIYCFVFFVVSLSPILASWVFLLLHFPHSITFFTNFSYNSPFSSFSFSPIPLLLPTTLSHIPFPPPVHLPQLSHLTTFSPPFTPIFPLTLPPSFPQLV